MGSRPSGACGVPRQTRGARTMVTVVDIDSNIDAALRDFTELERRQLPFALSGAMLDTAFDVRRRIVGSTYPEAFDVKNKRFAGVMFKVTKDGAAVRRGAAAGITRELRSAGEVSVSVKDTLGRDYMQRHTRGGTKTPRGGSIAVPVTPGEVRGASGRVLARNKPLALGKKRNHFTLYKGGRKAAVMRRDGDALTAVYLFLKQAGIEKSFRFYEDAEQTALSVFSGHFDNRLARALRSMRR